MPNVPMLTNRRSVTASAVANAGDIMDVDATAGNVTITLPSDPVDGWEVWVIKNEAGGNDVITIAGSGDEINGATAAVSMVAAAIDNRRFRYCTGAAASWYVV